MSQIRWYCPAKIFVIICFVLVIYINLKQVVEHNMDSEGVRVVAAPIASAIVAKQVPIIYIITPTYSRPTQIPEMTRLAQTLMHVKKILWIVVEDSTTKSMALTELLDRSDIPYVHLLAPKPKEHSNVLKDGRGVSNRLRALDWIRENCWSVADHQRGGVIYFADDDNTYDIRLFDEIRPTKCVSVFPVGLIEGTGLSAPILNNLTAKVIGWHDPCPGRKFGVDMAGFAISLDLFLSRPNVSMVYKAGFVEDSFLRSLEIQVSDLEPMASNCTVILVWHTKSKFRIFPKPENMKKVKNYNNTNLPILYNNLNKALSYR